MAAMPGEPTEESSVFTLTQLVAGGCQRTSMILYEFLVFPATQQNLPYERTYVLEMYATKCHHNNDAIYQSCSV